MNEEIENRKHIGSGRPCRAREKVIERRDSKHEWNKGQKK